MVFWRPVFRNNREDCEQKCRSAQSCKKRGGKPGKHSPDKAYKGCDSVFLCDMRAKGQVKIEIAYSMSEKEKKSDAIY